MGTFRILKQRSGMTLVEMMISLSILALASLTFFALLNGSLGCFQRDASTAYADSMASVAIQKLANDVRDGSSASISNGILTVNFPTMVTDPSTGEKLYSPGGIGQTRSYFRTTDGRLIRQINGVNRVLARHVSSVSFSATYGIVSVDITTTERVGNQDNERTQTDHAFIKLRNYRSM